MSEAWVRSEVRVQTPEVKVQTQRVKAKGPQARGSNPEVRGQGSRFKPFRFRPKAYPAASLATSPTVGLWLPALGLFACGPYTFNCSPLASGTKTFGLGSSTLWPLLWPLGLPTTPLTLNSLPSVSFPMHFLPLPFPQFHCHAPTCSCIIYY